LYIKYDHPTVITLLLSLPHILGLKGETVVLQQSRPVGLKYDHPTVIKYDHPTVY
jgi:hypothetical protein